VRLFVYCCLLLLTACAAPHVIVLNDPLDARQHNDLGIAYEQRGEDQLAAREYRKAAELDERWARPWVNLGNVLAAKPDWAEAVKAYRQALQRDPGLSEAMNNLAWVLLQDRQLEKARSWIEKAVAATPEQPAYLDTLADIEIALGHPQQALAAIEKALPLTPPSSPLRQALEAKRDRLNGPSQ
jgi:Flp pilus assembly protein TadD